MGSVRLNGLSNVTQRGRGVEPQSLGAPNPHPYSEISGSHSGVSLPPVKLGDVWRHVWLSQLRGVPGTKWVEARDAAQHPAVPSMGSPWRII